MISFTVPDDLKPAEYDLQVVVGDSKSNSQPVKVIAKANPSGPTEPVSPTNQPGPTNPGGPTRR